MNHRINMYIDLNTKEYHDQIKGIYNEYYDNINIIRLHIISIDRDQIIDFINRINNVKIDKERYYNLEYKSKYEHTIESHRVKTSYTILLNKLKWFNKRIYNKMFTILKIYDYNIYDDIETFYKNYYAEIEFNIVEDEIDEIV